MVKITWRPYDTDDVQPLIPMYCIDNSNIWRAHVPLICFHIIEWHQLDRVLHQFDMTLPISDAPIDLCHLHNMQLIRKIKKN